MCSAAHAEAIKDQSAIGDTITAKVAEVQLASVEDGPPASTTQIERGTERQGNAVTSQAR